MSLKQLSKNSSLPHRRPRGTLVFLAADHGGYELKEKLKTYLDTLDVQYEDCGSHRYIARDDYPDMAKRAAWEITQHPHSKAILVCASGNGMAIVANRFPRVRAALCLTPYLAKMARQDEDANILVLAGKVTTLDEAKRIIKMFLTTPTSKAKRHIRRRKKIPKLIR